MSISERPGVYSSYEVSSSLSGSGRGAVIGIIAEANSGKRGECYSLSSYAEAVSKFGKSCNLSELIRLALLNGASNIAAVAVSLEETPSVQDYGEALSALSSNEAVRIIICDSRKGEVHSLIRESILSAPERCKHRIGIVESGATGVQELSDAAGALNCERMVLAAPCESGENSIPGSAAAALAGLISYGGDPALPLNGAELFGINNLSGCYSDNEISSLILGGVCPLENISGSVSVIRGVTTRTTSGGVVDATWRELTTTLITDDVITTVRDSLRTRFARSKNTVQSRGAIRTQVIIELENKKSNEIIDSYENVTVTASAEDPTICIVAFEFTVAHGLNQIHLSAHITV